jgi:hypothetical protein
MRTTKVLLAAGIVAGFSVGAWTTNLHTQVSANTSPSYSCMAIPSGRDTASFFGVTLQAQRFALDPLSPTTPTAKSGNRFYVVHLLIVNTGHRNVGYDTTMFKLQSDDGNIYNTSELGGLLGSLLMKGALGPNERVAGDVLFEAPVKTHFTMLWDVASLVPTPLLTTRYHFIVPSLHIALPKLL